MRPINLFLISLLMITLSLQTVRASLSPNTHALTVEVDQRFDNCKRLELITYQSRPCQPHSSSKPAVSGWVFGVFCALVWAKVATSKKR